MKLRVYSKLKRRLLRRKIICIYALIKGFQKRSLVHHRACLYRSDLATIYILSTARYHGINRLPKSKIGNTYLKF